MSLRVAIVGAGIVGRLLALECSRRGMSVTLFDEGSANAERSCSFVAAAMLAPFSELEYSSPLIAELGQRSLKRWPEIIASLDRPVFFKKAGSLVIAHPKEEQEFERLRARVREAGFIDEISDWGRDALQENEPLIAERFRRALFIAEEGQVDNRAILAALAETLAKEGVDICFGRAVDAAALESEFDWVCDCGGIRSRPADRELRGVRGEAILVEANEVELQRPVRLMHPRYPLYIVPRPNRRFIVGATSIEAEDFSPLSVRSALELLSAAFSVIPAFAEGRILETMIHCRPAYPNHLPRISTGPASLRINGLYRHGYLISPAITRAAAEYLSTGAVDELCAPLFSERREVA